MNSAKWKTDDTRRPEAERHFLDLDYVLQSLRSPLRHALNSFMSAVRAAYIFLSDFSCEKVEQPTSFTRGVIRPSPPISFRLVQYIQRIFNKQESKAINLTSNAYTRSVYIFSDSKEEMSLFE